MKSIIYTLLFTFMFIFLNCYTIVERNNSLRMESSKYLNRAIVSSWSKTNYWTEGPAQTKVIDFQPDGDYKSFPKCIQG